MKQSDTEAEKGDGDDTDKAKSLVFDKSQEEMVQHLEEDSVIDERDLVVSGSLDEGTLSEVLQGTYCGTPVAIKKPQKGLGEKDARSLRIEGRTLRLLHHPFICEYVGHTENPFCIITRLYPRNLDIALKEHDEQGNPVLTLEDKFRIAYQLAVALQHLHSHGILHRDVKPEKIFLDEKNNVRLGGLGLSMYAPGLVYDNGDPVGSPLYMAPEVLSQFAFDAKCEVYTYGLMLYEIFTGHTVFPGVKSVQELAEIQKQEDPLPLTEADFSQSYGDGHPPREFWDFAKQCWNYYPDKRPTMNQVISKIVTIGVHTAIPHSQTAEKFWLKCSSSVYRDYLPLSQVALHAIKVNGMDLPTLIAKTALPSWKLLTIREFWMLCCWYPNFFANRDSVLEMARIVQSPWFVSDEIEADARLGNSSRRLFAICPSTNEPLQAPFTLCVTPNGLQEKHRIIRKHDTRNKRQMYFCPSLIHETSFTSISHLAVFVTNDLGFSSATSHTFRMIDDIYVE